MGGIRKLFPGTLFVFSFLFRFPVHAKHGGRVNHVERNVGPPLLTIRHITMVEWTRALLMTKANDI